MPSGPGPRLQTKPVCICNEGWICEEHPDRGWPHDDCAGPGMPCPRCNPGPKPFLPADWEPIV